MSWDKGFNFRGSSGYVTDGANTTYVLSSDAYPVTRNSVTFGWTVNPTNGLDRNSGADVRLAGINYGNGNGTFRVDLPATGSYAIFLGIVDQGSDQTGCNFSIKDNGSTLFSVGPVSPTSGVNCNTGTHIFDATGTELDGCSAWSSGQASVTKTFASTILQLTLDAATTNSTIAHLFISQVNTDGIIDWLGQNQGLARAHLPTVLPV